MELLGNIKTYDWGKIGLASQVSELAKLNDSSFNLCDKSAYAELWMGDHISGPSKLKKSGDTLNSTNRLPFLFKVLSINKALSIQVHPSKEEAVKLNSARPDLYRDSNHKPELAIALTPFLALCGFRPTKDIYMLIQDFPDLIDVIGTDNINQLNTGENEEKSLKNCFTKLMTAKQSDINTCIEKLAKKMNKKDKNDLIAKTFLSINKDFPNDVGVLCLFFLNILQLKPGEAIYLAAKEPHAYLEGDCIECMACSDNVVRCGLTPKFKDVDTLLNMLSYKAEKAENKFFKSVPVEGKKYTQLFIPEVKDFAVAQIIVPKTESYYTIESQKYDSIMIVLQGKAKVEIDQFSTINSKRGSIIFIPANVGTVSFNIENTNENYVCYQAMYNDFI